MAGVQTLERPQARGASASRSHRQRRHASNPLEIDDLSLGVASKLHAGCADLLEAAQTVDIILALLPAMKEGAAVRFVVGYQLQCAILEN
eukprot:701658-Pyramimonas_sp.AAC.1